MESRDSSHIKIAQQSVRGSVILFAGSLVQNLALAVNIIVIARLLGPSSYGIYSLSFVIPGLLQLFLGLGVSVAVTRYSAYYVSIGKPEEAKRFSSNAVLFLMLFGLALVAVNYIAAGVLSSYVLQRPGISSYVQVASLAILGQAVLGSSVAALIGWNSMRLAATAQALQGILRFVVSVGLVIAGFGVPGAVWGNVISSIVAGIASTTALYAVNIRGQLGGIRAFLGDVKEMMRYGIPVFAGSLVSGLASSYLLIVLAAIASNAVVGYYQAASNVTIPISLASSSIASALFPAFARLQGIGGDIVAALKHAVKYVAYLITPITLFLAASAAALIDILYGTSYSSGIVYLQLLSLSNLPILLGLTVIGTFFQGVARTRLTMVTSVSGAAALAVLAPFFGFGLHLGVPGLIYASLLSNVATIAVGLFLAERHMHATIDYRSAVGVLLASLIAFGLAFPVSLLGAPQPFLLIAQIAVFAVVYLTTAPLLRALTLDDIVRLEKSTEGMGVLGRATKLFLDYERFLTQRLISRK